MRGLSIHCRIGIDELPVREGPVDDGRFPYNIEFRDKIPVARIIALRAIIAHDKVLVGRHLPFAGNRIGRGANIRLIQKRTIDPDMRAIYADRIARDANNALNEVYARVTREVEHNHVSTFRRLKQIECLVYYHIFIIEQTRLHTLAFHMITLNGKSNPEEDDQSNYNYFYHFPY